MVYVVDRITMSNLDSAVVKNGTFTMEGTAEKEALLSVLGQYTNWYIPFFNDGQPITVNIDQRSLKGSALNEKVVSCDLDSWKNIEVLVELSEEMESLDEEEQKTRLP